MPFPPRPAPAEGAAPMTGLIRLGKAVLDRTSELGTYYLIGRAYRGGCTSLRDVSREFERRDVAGFLPDGVGTTCGHLSSVVRDLETHVFAPYFGLPCLRLLDRPRGEGMHAVPSPDGWQAWEEALRFLSDFYELPVW